MEATENKQDAATVADVASVRAEIEIDRAAELLTLVDMLIKEGAAVQVIIHHSEAQAAVERFESVEIGDAKWRQSLMIPTSLSLDERNRYIQDRAVGAAQAFAAAAAAAKGA